MDLERGEVTPVFYKSRAPKEKVETEKKTEKTVLSNRDTEV